MTEIFPGRYTAEIEGDFVVFLIGMRVNRPWRLRKLAFMAGTMPRLLRELDAEPAHGCLGSWQVLRSPIAPTVIQYWRSFEELEAYAAALTCCSRTPTRRPCCKPPRKWANARLAGIRT